ncbi:hypothetical protein PFTANZ_06468, partial [Plasmodium falciparum Tanzania (2000708)]
QKQCRGNYGAEKRYCSRNGCDCEQTVNARGKLRYGNRCIDCLYACNPYVEWIEKQKEQFDKQKEQFEKQKQRYENVINGTSTSSRAKRAATTKYEGYEKKFYKKLNEQNYGTVDAFLGLLNKEEVCTAVKDSEGGIIDFKNVKSSSDSGVPSGASGTNVEKEGTFYRSKYCQPCPPCGVERNGSGWKDKKNGKCTSGNLYTISTNAPSTNIDVLSFGDKRDEIKSKIDKFCLTQNGSAGGGGGSGGRGGKNSNNQELYEEWKCYKHEHVQKVVQDDDDDEQDYRNMKSAGGLCILKNDKNKKEEKTVNEPEQFQKTYNDFFYYWVAHMLKDSIHWRTKKIKSCISNGKQTKCRKGCKGDCDCFQRWITQKKNEWKPIKEHFKTQNIRDETDCDPIVTLEGVLQIEFLK